jgi:hypothetical protein
MHMTLLHLASDVNGTCRTYRYLGSVAIKDSTRARKTYSFFRTQPIIIEGENITVTIGVRDPQWWDSSTDSGTYSGTPAPLQSGAFTSTPNRINRWDGSAPCSSTLPAFGAGDHNKCVAYQEASGTGAAAFEYLTLVPAGATAINAGNGTGLTEYKLSGVGAKHVFRYDEAMDKFVLVEGPDTLSARGLRKRVQSSIIGIDFNPVSISGAVSNDVVISGRLAYVELDANTVFGAITGFDALTTRDDPDFCPRKILMVKGQGSGLPVVLMVDNLGSLAGNRISRFDGSGDDVVILAGQAVELQYFRDIEVWAVLPLTSPLGQHRAGQTANCTALRLERVLADASGGSLTVTAPSSPVQGDEFAVKATGNAVNTVSVSGGAFNIEDPNTPGTIGGPWILTLNASVQYSYDSVQGWLKV